MRPMTLAEWTEWAKTARRPFTDPERPLRRNVVAHSADGDRRVTALAQLTSYPFDK